MYPKRIYEKIKETEDSIELIDKNLQSSIEEFKGSGLVKDGIYKRLEFCIENLIDIGMMIITEKKIGMPKDDEDIITKLQENKVISAKNAEILKDMKGLRNILVHKYGSVNDEIIYENLQSNLEDFDKIISDFLKYMKKR
jgi:uncharacterized protein YutE (UPF0331/DUF86 family)